MAGIKLIRITTVYQSIFSLISGQCKYMGTNGFDVIAVSAGNKSQSEEVEKKEHVKHHSIPFTRSITPFQDLWCLLKLIILFYHEKPAIVHTHTPKAGLLGMIAASIMSVPVRIHTLAGLPLMVETGFKRKFLMWIEKITYSCSTEVWPNSLSGKDFIINHHLVETNKVYVIGKGSSNGINLSKFSKKNLDPEKLNLIKNNINFQTKSFYLIAIGRMVKDKGINELIQTFSNLQHLHSDLKLILIGHLEQKLDPLHKETLHQIHHNESITYIPWSDDVEYYLSFSNLLIHASHREGFPNVLLQAGAMQCPILCSDIPGNTDILPNTSFGLHFTTGNVVAMQQNITFAIENKNELIFRAQNLHQRIIINFEQKQIHLLIKKKYVQLLTDKKNY